MDIRSLSKHFILASLFVACPFAVHAAPKATYLQVIQIVNFLSNINLSNPGLTPTSVTIQFIDSVTNKACWSSSLAYLADFTIRSGAGQNCPNLISEIKVTPIVVASVLQTYSGPYTIAIDPTKYSSQITINQATAPVFDSTNGLVTTPGTITADIQAQFNE